MSYPTGICPLWILSKSFQISVLRICENESAEIIEIYISPSVNKKHVKVMFAKLWRKKIYHAASEHSYSTKKMLPVMIYSETFGK